MKRHETRRSWDRHLATLLRWSDHWSSPAAAVSASRPITLLVPNQIICPRHRVDRVSMFWVKQSRVLEKWKNIGKIRKLPSFCFSRWNMETPGGRGVQLKNKSTGCGQARWFVMPLLPPTCSEGAAAWHSGGGLSRSNLIWLKWIWMSSRSDASFFSF